MIGANGEVCSKVPALYCWVWGPADELITADSTESGDQSVEKGGGMAICLQLIMWFVLHWYKSGRSMTGAHPHVILCGG